MSRGAGLAAALLQAQARATPLAPACGEGLTLDDGLQVQHQALARRLAAGERLTGWKVAFAGAAAQRRFGLSEPVYGALTDAMCVPPGTTLALGGLVQPKLEVELALILGAPLRPGTWDDAALLGAVAAVAPAFEVADCRWSGWRFGAGAFLADNAAAALYCLGETQAFGPAHHAGLDWRLESEGAVLGAGSSPGEGDAPLPNACWALRRLLADGASLQAGQVILSGALLPPLDIRPVEYRLRMLGTELALRFVQDDS